MILGSVLAGRASGLEQRCATWPWPSATDLADFAGDLDGASADVTLGDAGAQLATTLQLSATDVDARAPRHAHPERSGSGAGGVLAAPRRTPTSRCSAAGSTRPSSPGRGTSF